MKKIFATILAALALAGVAAPAMAATAFLQSCTTGTSVTGQFILIGIYQYGNTRFQRTFPGNSGWCPQSVEVY